MQNRIISYHTPSYLTVEVICEWPQQADKQLNTKTKTLQWAVQSGSQHRGDSIFEN